MSGASKHGESLPKPADGAVSAGAIGKPRSDLRFPDGKTVIYCIGAQKAGTTWLADYVSNHPDCNLPVAKECHFFDVQSGADMQARKVSLNGVHRSLKRLEEAAPKDFEQAYDSMIAAAKRAELYLPGDRGLAAYLNLMTKSAGNARNLCDFTPSYAACDRTVFTEMDALADEAKFVFIMRDPVERLWSQARMAGKNVVSRRKDVAFDKVTRHSLRHYLGKKKPGELPRSNYARTIAELEAAIPADRILYLFYETLFTDESIKKFCEFVDIPVLPADFSAGSNVGVSMKIPPRIEIELREGLLEQYAFVREKFGEAVPKSWYDPERDPMPKVPQNVNAKKNQKDLVETRGKAAQKEG